VSRERKEYYLQDNIIFRNPVALAAASSAAPASANAAPASAPSPAQGSFAQMLQPAMGDAAAAPAAASAAASDVAAAMGLQAAGAYDTKPRQTLNDIATIATAQLTQHQGEICYHITGTPLQLDTIVPHWPAAHIQLCTVA
jgi:hypothetical protein